MLRVPLRNDVDRASLTKHCFAKLIKGATMLVPAQVLARLS